MIRKPLVKILSRAVLYGLTAWAGMTAVEADEATMQIASGLAAVVAFVAGAMLDRWHNKKDRSGQ